VAATASRGPLAGRRVIELAGIGPAPFACMALADMGADVIRIDRPSGQELGTAPPASDLLNRGKRSVVLDLKHPDGREAALTLAAGADVLAEAFRPGVAERLGVGPDAVWERNPRLVYGRMTGWGQEGPLAATAGHDISYIAVTGVLHAIGAASGPPQIPLALVGDYAGGAAYLVIGVLAALLEAERTGRGQVIDAAIVDGVSHLLASIHAMLGAGRWTDQRGSNLLDGGSPFYAVYQTADGRYMAVGALEARFFAELLRLLKIDPGDFHPAEQHTRERWPFLRQKLSDVFGTRTQAEWAEVFAGTDACVTPVVSLREAAAHPQVMARGSITDSNGILQPGTAPRFSRHPVTMPGSPPVPGQHTREVLRAAGIDPDELIRSGAAVQA
jgi:alpha-methylacyl-CoA racemase